jgi:hypothetical protein
MRGDQIFMRAGHSLQGVRARRQHRANFIALIVFWFAMDDICLCAIVGSGSETILSYVPFFLFNTMLACLCYIRWTDPRYKRLREDSRRTRHLHVLSGPKDPKHSTSDL